MNATAPVYFRYAAVLAFVLACGAYTARHAPPKQWPVPQRAMKGDRLDRNLHVGFPAAPETHHYNGPYRLYGGSRIA